MATHFHEIRVDARGHVQAVLMYDDVADNRQWYDLAGDPIGDPVATGTIRMQHLQIDARGHVYRVLAWYAAESAYYWYDLTGTPQTPMGTPGSYEKLTNLQIDARGHIVAVEMDGTNWFDLAGEAA